MSGAFTKLFPPKVEAYNPDHSFVVIHVTRWRLAEIFATLPGVVFTHKPGLLGFAEFEYDGVKFQMDDGGDMGGDGLWIMPQDHQRHPAELQALREHVEKSLLGAK
jgi:hypothetical protein